MKLLQNNFCVILLLNNNRRDAVRIKEAVRTCNHEIERTSVQEQETMHQLIKLPDRYINQVCKNVQCQFLS